MNHDELRQRVTESEKVLYRGVIKSRAILAMFDENEALRDLLRRLDEWDVMRANGEIRSTHDSPYWRREIAKALGDAS